MTAAARENEIRRAVAELEELFGADAIRELLEIFLAESSTLLDTLEGALHSGDLGAAARCAHGLKGIAGNFGASAVVTLADRIERGATERLTPAALEPLFAELERETLAVREVIGSLL